MTESESFKTIPEQISGFEDALQKEKASVLVEGFFSKFKNPLDKKQDDLFGVSKNLLTIKNTKIKKSYVILGGCFLVVFLLCIIALNFVNDDNKPSVSQQIQQIQKIQSIAPKPKALAKTPKAIQELQMYLDKVNVYLQNAEYKHALIEAEEVNRLLQEASEKGRDNNLFILRIQYYNHLSEIHYRLNKMQEAVLFSDKALKQALTFYGLNGLQTAKQYDLIAFHLDNVGDFEKALRFRHDAIKIRLKYDDTKVDAGKLINDMNNLGEEYRTLGYFKESQEILVQAIRRVEKKHGIDAPELIVILNNLGLTHQENNDRIIGLSFLQQAYLLSYKHYGTDHKLTKLIVKNLTRLRNLKV